MRRICFVGAGFISQHHAEALRTRPNLRLQAIVDPDIAAARKLARRWDVPQVFTSVEEALAADAFDCAHVLVPPDIHCTAALPILRAAKPVLMEKPLASSSAECEMLLNAAQAGAVLGVNHNLLHHPALLRLRALLGRLTLGKPRFVSCIYNMPLRQLALGQIGHWMFRAPTNLLLEQATHSLSQIAVLAGPIEEMRAIADAPTELAPGVLFHASMTLALRCRDVPAELRFAVGQSFPFCQITVVCDDGVLVADMLANRVFRMAQTRWNGGLDGLASGCRTATDIVGAAVRNTVDYGLATLRVKGRAAPFVQTMNASIAAFHDALDIGRVPESDGHFGAALVAACEQAGEQLAAPVRTPSLSRSKAASHAPFPRDDAASVAVIGGTGFIGLKVVERLVGSGRSVRLIARNVANPPPSLRHPAIALRKGDIRDADDVARAIGSAKQVINLAHGGGGGSWEEIREGMVGGAENVARACLAAGVERLLHVGSIASLYLGPQPEPVTGAAPPDPLSVLRADYARAKALCDQLLLDLHARDGLPVTILRPGLVVGEGRGPFHSGLGFYNNERHCIGWNGGRNPLPFVLVEDVADAICRALDAEDIAGRSFNLVGDVRPTARQYIHELGRALGRPLRFHGKAPPVLWSEELVKWGIKRAARRRAPLPRYRDILSRGLVARFDCEDAKRMLGWRPVAQPEEFWRRAIGVHAGL